MSLLKKLSADWQPVEKKDLQVGEVFDYPGDVTALVKNGSAIVVDELGNEQPLPGTVFTCPVCYMGIEDLNAFSDHFVNAHRPATKTAPVLEAPTGELKTAVEDIKAKRLAALARGREKAKANRDAKKESN